jgi:hypothetical protein
MSPIESLLLLPDKEEMGAGSAPLRFYDLPDSSLGSFVLFMRMA